MVRVTGATQFYDTAITPGVRYYYWVRSKNRFGYGAYCNPDWGYAGMPPAVISVTATNGASANWVLVEWDSLEGGAYEVWRNNRR